MKLLALDTCTDACSVALMVGHEVIQEHRVAAQQHATLILPMIDSLLADAQLTTAELDGIVYGRGPGSFTGVRICVALTQGLALGADIGVMGISALQCIAQGCLREYGDTHVACSIDARMDECYFCAYEENEKTLMVATIEESVCRPENQLDVQRRAKAPDAMSLQAEIKASVWAGSGAQRYARTLRDQFNVSDERIRLERLPQAQDMISLAVPEVIEGRLLDPAMAAPVYLRNKVAHTTQERLALQGQGGK